MQETLFRKEISQTIVIREGQAYLKEAVFTVQVNYFDNCANLMYVFV